MAQAEVMVCTVCGCEDEASFFLANLGYCPSCGEEATVRKAKQIRFDKLRCTLREHAEHKERR